MRWASFSSYETELLLPVPRAAVHQVRMRRVGHASAGPSAGGSCAHHPGPVAGTGQDG